MKYKIKYNMLKLVLLLLINSIFVSNTILTPKCQNNSTITHKENNMEKTNKNLSMMGKIRKYWGLKENTEPEKQIISKNENMRKINNSYRKNKNVGIHNNNSLNNSTKSPETILEKNTKIEKIRKHWFPEKNKKVIFTDKKEITYFDKNKNGILNIHEYLLLSNNKSEICNSKDKKNNNKNVPKYYGNKYYGNCEKQSYKEKSTNKKNTEKAATNQNEEKPLSKKIFKVLGVYI